MTGRITAAALCCALCLAASAPAVRAQTAGTSPALPPVETLYADAVAKETAVRKALAARPLLPTVLKAVRTVVGDFENVVRHYPTSSYCDDALWRGGQLAKTAFDLFHEARERNDALRLLKLLASGYPSSRFARLVPAEVAVLNSPASVAAMTPSRDPSTVAPPAPAPAAPPATTTSVPAAPAAPAAGSPPATLANIKDIRRTVLKDVVRVVIELDREVPFHDERLEGPARVFVDLPSTRLNATLVDHTIRFDADNDLVRQIRVGRHPNSTTRVVLEAAGVSSYSVYPLYSPYRLVIDCLRADASVAAVEPSAPAPPAAPRASDPAPVVMPPTPQLAAMSATVGHLPAAPVPDPPSDRPAWVSRLLQGTAPRPENVGVTSAVAATAAIAPGPLAARRIRWVTKLPAGTVRALPPAADAPTAAARATPLPATPTVQPPVAPTPPSRNVAGGLSIARQLGLGVSRIVIDPGHGGHDPGAKGLGVTEAELTLDVALRLEKLLAKVPGVEVVLTRRADEFISLQERTAIANREGADLFLSIHANASSVPSARGVETYFLDFATNRTAAAVAARENASSGQTMGALQDVVKAITLNSKLDESRDFATYVQKEMLGTLRPSNKTLKDLGVKQAPFVVLIGASMPSILAEVSFVTNPQEAKLLKSSSYRQKIAQALFEGVKKYQVSLKAASSIAQQ